MKAFTAQTVFIQTNGIRLHAQVSGLSTGPLVILLHGFPEYWAAWMHQIGALSEAGFRVVALDQRGYNWSDKPRGTASYRIEELAKDILGVIDHFQREKAIIIGHDWGAGIAWYVAIHYPERVEKVAILNVPHPAALARGLFTFTPQLFRSWYIYFFQIPRLPEFLLGLFHNSGLRRMLKSSSKKGTFKPEEMPGYTQAWDQAGAVHSMISWYRAAFQAATKQSREEYFRSAQLRVSVPTLILWGEKDIALIPQLAQWSLEWCDQGKLIRFPNATHWVQHDEPDKVNQYLVSFCGAGNTVEPDA